MTANGTAPDAADAGEGRKIDQLGGSIASEHSVTTAANQELQFHPLADLFPLMEGEEFKELVGDIEAHGQREPIVVHEGMILDGRNRYRACREIGLTPWTTSFEIVASTNDSAEAYAISANIRRRHLTAVQKRDLIAKLIEATPEKSDRQIAETVKASPTTVGTIRAEMEEAGEVSKLDTRIDAKGIKQPAKKKASVAKAQREKARARREAKRKQKNEELRKKLDAEEAAAEAKAAQLAADLIKADLARRVLAYLIWEDDGTLLIDALRAVIEGKPSESNDIDAEASADAMKAKMAALETDGGAS